MNFKNSLNSIVILALFAVLLGCNNDDDGVQISLQNLEITLDENPAEGVLIGVMETDGGEAANFSFVSQSPAGAMSIDASSGEITVADASLFDFEANPTLTATVTADNAKNTASLQINLNNLNEISAQNLEVTIAENPTDGQVLGSIQVNESGTYSFSITSQTPAGAMSIDANTGALAVADPNLFDFETNPVITASVLVEDGVFTQTVTATVNLSDVDEITVQEANFTIAENPSNGAVVGTIQASGGSGLTYSITFQNPAGAFSINQNTGVLSVADGSLFDFETNPNMLATISVSNGASSVSSNAFVSLTDANEIGEYKYGGVIFWVNASGDEGLVIGLTNLSGNATWGCTGVLTGASGDAIGAGQANTNTIITAGCTTATSAAVLASNLDTNGYDDWYLPTTAEWTEVFNNLSSIKPAILSNGGDDFLPAYWTSTENDAFNSDWFLLEAPGEGIGYSFNKSNTAATRAIRAWTDL
ncbi:hypothetical protein [Leeuwenhoekiella sp. H156]|uniref:hypothetical protein n=1 Tax=Leeuwenhoekiella sp. H156 TaxID=3450128 RepID=UPI003FA4ACBE